MSHTSETIDQQSDHESYTSVTSDHSLSNLEDTDPSLNTTIKANPEAEKCFRKEIIAQINELNSLIENSSVFHKSLIETLRSEKATIDILEGLKHQLAQGKLNIIQAHDQWRSMLGNIPPDLKTRNQIDQVLADNERLTDEITIHIEKLSPPSQPPQTQPSTLDEPSTSTLNAPQIVLQSSLPHSRTHSISRSSRTSASSQTSSKVRFKQLEAKANIVAMKKRLAASKETQELEHKARLLAQAIEQQKMQAELEAAEAVEQVYSQALEEEDSRSLFRPPSVVNLQHSNDTQIMVKQPMIDPSPTASSNHQPSHQDHLNSQLCLLYLKPSIHQSRLIKRQSPLLVQALLCIILGIKGKYPSITTLQLVQ